VSKWDKIIENALADISTETPGGGNFRVNVGHKLFEAEQIAAQAEQGFLGETPAQRVSNIRQELSAALGHRLKRDPGNKIWQ
jgi:hypothetical protein